MKKPALIAPAAALVLVAMVYAQGNLAIAPILPDQMKWKGGSSPGVESVLLAGAPEKAGFYTVRVRLAPGGLVPPHTHPDARYVTVLSGAVYLGSSETVDAATAKMYPAETFFVVPAGMVHYSWAKDGEATYQESGIGPTANNFLRK